MWGTHPVKCKGTVPSMLTKLQEAGTLSFTQAGRGARGIVVRERLACLIVITGNLGRVVRKIVHAPRRQMDPAIRYSAEDDLICDVNVNYETQGCPSFSGG